VHRDVKPANVMIEGSRCYLTDFGLTKQLGSDSAALTAVGQFVGTVDYVAPEQIRGAALDGRVDVYALGCVLHECLTASRPYPKDSELSVIYAHLEEPPPRPSSLRPSLPAAVDDVVARALAKDPGDRFESCGALVAAARAALASGGAAAAVSGDTGPAASPGTAPTRVGGPAATQHGQVPGTGEAAPPAQVPPAQVPPAQVPPAEAPTQQSPTEPPPQAPPAESKPPAQPPPARKRGPLVAILAGVAFLAALGVAAALLLFGKDDGDDTKSPAAKRPPGKLRVVGKPIRVGTRPFGVAVGDGVLWVANASDDTVSRVAVEGGARTDVRVGAGPFGITRAGDDVWVANSGAGSVTRIDTRTGTPGDEIPVGRAPFFVAADDSSVFVSNGAGTKVTVLDARTGERAGASIRVCRQPRGIVAGGTATWVVCKSGGAVRRIVNGQVTRTIAVGENPVGIAIGGNALWVTNRDSGTVSRIDLSSPEGGEAKTIEVGSEPFGIAFGEGFAWVTLSGEDKLLRLDPETGEPVGDPIAIPGQPVGVTVGGGSVWVTANDAGTLTRVDPG
jgi:YVTN family beta-propeller protein